MCRNLIFFCLIVLISCNQTIDDKFSIVSKFNESKNQYCRDSINLEGLSLEGSELIVYRKNSDSLILDIFLYGETGKLNYTYFTNNKFEYKFAVKRDYRYNGLITDENIEIDSTIYFLENQKLYNEKKVEIKDLEEVKLITTEIDVFYKDILNLVNFNK